MNSIKINTHIDHDGMLKIEIPIEEKDTDIEVVLVYETQAKEKDEWPESFFDLYGSAKDTPFVEPDELPFEEREKLK